MSEIATALHRIWEIRRLLLVAAVIAVVIGLLTVAKPTSEPPFLESRSFVRGVASTEVLVDSTPSALTDVQFSVESLGFRAETFVQFTDTPEVRALIAQRADIPVEELAVQPYAERKAGIPARDPTAGESADELTKQALGHRVEVRSAGNLPLITVSAQAPDAESAAKLANTAADVTIEYLEGLAAPDAPPEPTSPLPPERRPDLSSISFERLGDADAAEVAYGGGYGRGVVVAVFAWLVLSTIFFFVVRLRSEARRSPERDDDDVLSFDVPASR